MKYNAEPMEVLQFRVDNEVVKTITIIPVDEDKTMRSFAYDSSQNKNLFKLVLNWKLILRSIDRKTILDMEAEQEFRVLFDDDNDKEVLKHLIAASHFDLQKEVSKGFQQTVLNNYKLQQVNDDGEAANRILASVDRL